MVDKVEAVIKRLRWKLFWYHNKAEDDDESIRENFGFKSKNTPPPPQKELENFENELLDMITTIKSEPTAMTSKPN